MQKFWKSVKIWQSYREFKGGKLFLRHSVDRVVTFQVVSFSLLLRQPGSQCLIGSWHSRWSALACGEGWLCVKSSCPATSGQSSEGEVKWSGWMVERSATETLVLVECVSMVVIHSNVADALLPWDSGDVKWWPKLKSCWSSVGWGSY